MDDFVRRDNLVHKTTVERYVRENLALALVLLGVLFYKIIVCI